MQPEQYGYWRSLAELKNTPDFQEAQRKEFPAGPDGDFTNTTRRRFLQLSAASATLAGVAGCRKEHRIAPYRSRPEDMIPGETMQFATCMDLGGVAYPLLVESFDYRPIKVEGSPDHPFSRTVAGNGATSRSMGRNGAPQTGYGACTKFAQAAILELYDPDRLQVPVFRGRRAFPSRQAAWQQFASWLNEHLGGNGSGVTVLSEPSASPTLARMRRAFNERFPQAQWVEYAPLASDNERAASELAFGRELRTDFDFSQARTIALFDADPFGSHPASIPYSRQLGEARDASRLDAADGWITRVYAFEAVFSNSGAAADHRLPCKSSDIRNLLLAVEAEIAHEGDEPSEALGQLVEDEKAQAYIRALAGDLKAHRGESAIVVGPRQPAEVIALAHRINAELGNVGTTVRYLVPEAADGGEPFESASNFEGLAELVEQMDQGEVETLIILGGNPAYDSPADVPFADALNKVKHKAHITLYSNETTRGCQWHLPLAHWLESWGDGLAWDGSLLLQQPLIDPLYEGRTPAQVVEMMLGRPGTNSRSLAQTTFAELQGLSASNGATLDREYKRAIHDGFVPDTAWETAEPSLESFEVAAADEPVTFPAPDSTEIGSLEANFVGCGKLYDGRFANNAWLQECPDFLSSLTWDNAALISPATAQRLGLTEQTLATFDFGGDYKLTAAVCIQPGQGPNTLTFWLGYGRTHVGRVGGDVEEGVDVVGFNTYSVRSTETPWIVPEVSVSTDPGTPYVLARVQDHFALDPFARKEIEHRVPKIVRTGTVQDYHDHPDFAQHLLHVPAGPDGKGMARLWEQFEYDGHKWGMATDLNKCTGCNACIVACQSENNIPTVGKDQVNRGREMHWLRIDRYFSGDPENPGVAGQPLLCQQCETAPCEQVCPVGATIHSHEGLNDMVYNRCIGTRYCSNNCPYKVRRFNYFYYHFDTDKFEVKQMAYNPQVTIRSRGVMEKCTFCVQRIQEKKIEAKANRRPMVDGEIVTACQQACPSQAIVFGDLNATDDNGTPSKVARLHATDRAYALLEDLMTKPRNLFLARIVNPHPDLGPVNLHKDHGHGHGHGDHNDGDHAQAGPPAGKSSSPFTILS